MEAFLVAAVLLSLERIYYIWVWQRPAAFQSLIAAVTGDRQADPVAFVRRAFYGFKVLQAGVFVAWCLAFGGGTLRPESDAALVLTAGGLLLAIGQVLNAGVFYRLGPTGVFYGTRFGHAVPWVQAFPFSLFAHPQYVGTVLTIWGVFIAMRFPAPDWYLLPALETVYYGLGARFER